MQLVGWKFSRNNVQSSAMKTKRFPLFWFSKSVVLLETDWIWCTCIVYIWWKLAGKNSLIFESKWTYNDCQKLGTVGIVQYKIVNCVCISFSLYIECPGMCSIIVVRVFHFKALQPTGWSRNWHCGVRVAKSGKLVGFISAVPALIKMYDK